MAKFQVELSEDLYYLINTRVGKFHKSLFAELALRAALENKQIMGNIPPKNKKDKISLSTKILDDTSEKSFTIDDDFV